VNDILNLLKNTYSKAYSAKGLSELYSSLMILSPYKSEKRSGLSTEVLNTELGYVLGFPQDRFCKDMKVVQTMNDYENMVMNGELGVIAWTNDHEVGVQFKDGQVVTYSILESQAMLDRAFALTVHKAQGSEAQTVWLVIEPGAYGIMSKQLLYTAITRAKDKLAFFALGDSLSVQQLHAIFNNEQDFVDSSMLQEVRT
jgi:ATP-dependent exoDNAse (exonuclease V) alpha subunit